MDKKYAVKLHIGFWLVVFSISILFSLFYIGNAIFVPLIVRILLTLSIDIFSFYLFYIILSPKLFTKKGMILISFWGVAYLFVSALLFSVISFFLYKYFYTLAVKPFELPLADWISNNVYNILSRNLIFSILGGLFKISFIWYKNQIKHREIEKQNISNELAMLRGQVNPHFLFNTLNNIKSLVMDLPSKAIISTGKLINIMNYMFFESSYDKVPFKKEIEHINNYLELERIRFINPNYIDFKISGDYSGIMIPPLIFMPFIENTFKHGDKLKSAPGIIIRFDITGTNILFEINNYIKENYIMHNKKSGFGLSNIKRRLDLLFGDKYELLIKDENNIFNVKLNLNIL
ncbi:MAG: histidine kinase [Ignavibacteriae bacterium]|nr:histidine kinase [Ignavibacteriota bacterium]